MITKNATRTAIRFSYKALFVFEDTLNMGVGFDNCSSLLITVSEASNLINLSAKNLYIIFCIIILGCGGGKNVQ